MEYIYRLLRRPEVPSTTINKATGNPMQPIRNTLRRVTYNIHRNTKPAATRNYSNMSLFPRFTQEFAPLFRLMDDYDRKVFRDLPNSQSLRNIQSFTPKFDVKEAGDAYELHGEFPGVEQKDISIEWTDANTLTVSGRHEHVREEGQRPSAAIEDASQHYEKPTAEDEASANKEVTKQPDTSQQEVTKNEDGPKYWVSERSVGEFHRSFSFPTRVDQDAVKASLKNGILSVIVPKAKAQQPRKVTIE
ncbi:HSP20-like chaperone [Massarina eburnea CBS 473.64]|uniref:HSP20-like chaperone n=1 Tax=Massarina eburnea CBS 473.64 TaxID=1395130 RepID=A0A6A6SFH7_9PLEO|nr:HSP20-like chaperone [Massarina eburnea CBS 473.64]